MHYQILDHLGLVTSLLPFGYARSGRRRRPAPLLWPVQVALATATRDVHARVAFLAGVYAALGLTTL